VEAGAEFTLLWTTSRPQRMRESRNHRNDADENERREEAHAQRQYRPNTSTLRRGLSVGSQRPASVVGKMHEDVGQCRTRVMRTNHCAGDRRPTPVARTTRPRGFYRRTKHRKARDRAEYGAHLTVECGTDRGYRRSRCGAGRQARSQQIEGGRDLPRYRLRGSMRPPEPHQLPQPQEAERDRGTTGATDNHATGHRDGDTDEQPTSGGYNDGPRPLGVAGIGKRRSQAASTDNPRQAATGSSNWPPAGNN
jgi:hypothetical protein